MRNIYTIIFILSLHAALPAQQCQNDSTGLIPITDLGTQIFNGMTGGLYGDGNNVMPPRHQNAGLQMASEIIPRNNQGVYDPNGKIGFISMGMSNANMFFAGLRDSSIYYSGLNSKLVMVNGATGGLDIDAMLDTAGQYWITLNQKLSAAGLHNNQVQVIWFMQAKHISGIPPNQGIAHIQIMESKFLQSFQYFKQRFPNLKQIFCSGRDYGGYNQPGSGNPEPYAYYTNWAFKKLVERQMDGDTLLSFSSSSPKTAWLAWANYVWADGKNSRSDGFNWLCPDDVQQDGVHPNTTGKAKVASLLFNFFKTDTTTYWYRQYNLPTSNQMNEDEVSNTYIKLSPNPANNVLKIESSGSTFPTCQIIDLQGRLIEEISGEYLSISNYPRGIYFVKYILNDRVSIGKFLKL